MLPFVDEITAKFVVPFYLEILHGNVVNQAPAADHEAALARMRAVAPEVTFDIALDLWPRGWREGLMASWWAAVWRWPGLVDQVEPLLIPSRSCFEGQAHCLALTRVNSRRSRAVLMRYLDEYLPRPDLDYDQPWAMASLMFACADAGESLPVQYTEAWQESMSGTRRADLGAVAGTLERMRALADAVARH